MKFAVIGECMLELAPVNMDQYRLNYGGDVMNTAIHVARAGIDTTFFSALGDGYYSDWLVNAWQEEGIACDEVQRLPGMEPAIYMIRNDDDGDRYFHYWRSASPFKLWLSDEEYCEQLPKKLAQFDHIHYSGITLAMLSEQDRGRLLALLADYRHQGGRVSFDPNYRPRLWSSKDAAILWLDRVYANADIAFPSLEDETLLRQSDSIEEVIDFFNQTGLKDLTVKAGSNGCWIHNGDAAQHIPVSQNIHPVDTTGAGDAFNAGYLVARFNGADRVAAANAGHNTAGGVLQYHGAIMPRGD